MSRTFITVLYEDQLAAKPTNYGPHILLLACVADSQGGDRWKLQSQVAANPKKGDSKLRAALRDEGALIAGTGHLIAMFDDDHVRTCYDLPDDTCKRAVLEAIGREATGSPTIVLLQRNMEDIVEACCAALRQPVPTSKPTPEERDRILHRAAAEGRDVRDAMLRLVPSFGRLVRVICEWLTKQGTGILSGNP